MVASLLFGSPPILDYNVTASSFTHAALQRGSAENMAVTKKYRSIKASILVNDAPLEEYDDDEARNDSSKVRKYIEAISGAEFAIQSRFDKLPKYDVRVNFYLDGHYASAKYVFLDRFKGDSSTQTSYGVRYNDGNKWQVHNYAFSNLQTSMCVAEFSPMKANHCKSRLRWQTCGRSVDEGPQAYG